MYSSNGQGVDCACCNRGSQRPTVADRCSIEGGRTTRVLEIPLRDVPMTLVASLEVGTSRAQVGSSNSVAGQEQIAGKIN